MVHAIPNRVFEFHFHSLKEDFFRLIPQVEKGAMRES